MALLKLVPFELQPSQEQMINDVTVIQNKIEYILRPDKAINHIHGGYNFILGSPNEIIEQFLCVNRWHQKMGHIPIRHMVLSLNPYSCVEEKITPHQLALIADRFCLHEFAEDYQALYAIHEDTQHLHAHILINTVNLRTGKLLPWNYTKETEMYEWMSLMLKLLSHSIRMFPHLFQLDMVITSILLLCIISMGFYKGIQIAEHYSRKLRKK